MNTRRFVFLALSLWLAATAFGCGSRPKQIGTATPAPYKSPAGAVRVCVSCAPEAIANLTSDTPYVIFTADGQVKSSLAQVGKTVTHRLKGNHLNIEQRALRLPDGRHLQVLPLVFPAEGDSLNIRIHHLEQLNQARGRMPKGQMILAGGSLGVSSAQDNVEHLYERYLQPTWLIGYQLGGPGCANSTSLGALLSKDFYDGTQGWIIQRQSLRCNPGLYFEITPVNGRVN